MKTISTKQLREDMPEVVKILRTGKPVRLSYRRRIIGTIRPHIGSGIPVRRGSASAVSEFLKQANFGSVSSATRQSPQSFKEEIAKLREKDL